MEMRFVILAAVAASAISGGTGAYIGYKYAEKKLLTEYDNKLQDELAAAKKFYTRLTKKDEYATPEEVLEDEAKDLAISILTAEKYVPEDGVVETRSLNKERPSTVSVDDFMENPKDYDQRTITYYEGDDVLVDEQDIPIEDIDGVIGLYSLDQFGVLSRNPDIVYIRNPRLAMDFEVLREKGSYEESVLGSIKHSDRRPRKFRIDDD